MLKLKLQYFGHLMRRVDSLEKTLMLGGIEGRRQRGRQRIRWLDGITHSKDVSLNSRSWWWTERPGVLQFMGLQRVRHDWVTELNWTELAWNIPLAALIFLKRSVVFPILLFSSYFLTLITEESFLISPCYSLDLCIQMGISFSWLSTFSF